MKFKGEMLEGTQGEKCEDDGHVVLQHRSALSCVISHGCNWWKKFRRPFQKEGSFRNTPNFLRHSSIHFGGWGADEKGKIKKKP